MTEKNTNNEKNIEDNEKKALDEELNAAEEINIIENETEKITKLEQEILVLKDTLIRKAADFDNAKKRQEKEMEDSLKYAYVRFSKDLLSVLDNFERVNQLSVSVKDKIDSENIKAFFDGIILCEKDLLATFKKYKINKIDANIGDKFDPQYHQAMCEIENNDFDANTIVMIMQSGYMYEDRLLRPVSVGVSRKK